MHRGNNNFYGSVGCAAAAVAVNQGFIQQYWVMLVLHALGIHRVAEKENANRTQHFNI